MENVFSENKKIYFSFLITIGCFWGFIEFLIGTALKEQIPNNIIGSVLIGLSFFFISISIFLRKKPTDVIIPLFICIILKLAGAILIGKSIYHSSIVNPIASLILEAGIFIALYFLFLSKENISLARKIMIGAAGGLLLSFLFPLLQYVTQLPICIKAGTNIPLSIYYSPISIVVGAIALPIGIYLNVFLRNFIINKKSFAFGLNLLSVIMIVLILIMI